VKRKKGLTNAEEWRTRLAAAKQQEEAEGEPAPRRKETSLGQKVPPELIGAMRRLAWRLSAEKGARVTLRSLTIEAFEALLRKYGEDVKRS